MKERASPLVTAVTAVTAMITGSSLTANVCVGQVVLAVVADVAAEGDFVHYWAQSNAGSLLVDALLHPSVRGEDVLAATATTTPTPTATITTTYY